VRNAALALLVVVAACKPHGPALPAVPGKGGPAWLELQSAHFTLWTDASRERAHELIREMEHLRQVILGVGFTGADVEGRSLVLALRDAEEVGVFLPEQFVAFAFAGGTARQPVIVLPADATGDDAPVVTHELTHVISYAAIRHQPHWFAEGLANFFATVKLDPDRATGNIGEPLPYIVARLRYAPPTPARNMFACDEHFCMNDMFYATAWAMFSFLANTYPQELLRYADRLDQLPEGRASEVQAWQEVFPNLTPEQLDHELRKWLAYGKHTVWTFNVKLQQWPVTERTLADADVYAARALMRQLFAKPGDAPAPELGEALAADSTHVLAHLVKAGYKQPITVDEARKVADAHPDDWRAWYLVGHAADWHGDPAREAWQKACAILATRPSPSMPRGWCDKH
jgi:hypothetical protein